MTPSGRGNKDQRCEAPTVGSALWDRRPRLSFDVLEAFSAACFSSHRPGPVRRPFITGTTFVPARSTATIPRLCPGSTGYSAPTISPKNGPARTAPRKNFLIPWPISFFIRYRNPLEARISLPIRSERLDRFSHYNCFCLSHSRQQNAGFSSFPTGIYLTTFLSP